MRATALRSTPANTPSPGAHASHSIATCYTYDQTGNIAWVGLATDSGSYFYGYNVTIPAIYKSILIGDVRCPLVTFSCANRPAQGVTPSSIEYGSA